MKKVLFLAIGILMAVLFSGCAGKQVEPNPVCITNEGVSKSSITINVSLSKKTSDKVSVIQEVAIAIKKAAEEFNKGGYEYFDIDSKSVPTLITNIEDLNAYCFPGNNGFHINETKSTSLEGEQCKKIRSFIGVSLSFYPKKEPTFNKPSWSVKEVLSNKNIDRYIEAALKDGNFEKKELKYTNNKKIYLDSLK